MEYRINDRIIITIDGEEYEAIIDEIKPDKILCHKPPKHYGYVYTAKIWEFPISEFGKTWRLLWKEKLLI